MKKELTPSHPDCERCKHERAVRAGYSKKKYAESKQSGRCVTCRRKTRDGKVRCTKCNNGIVDRDWMKRNASKVTESV